MKKFPPCLVGRGGLEMSNFESNSEMNKVVSTNQEQSKFLKLSSYFHVLEDLDSVGWTCNTVQTTVDVRVRFVIHLLTDMNAKNLCHL